MADELTPDQVRARRFDIVRKGYDRSSVDVFLTELANEIDRLRAEIREGDDREVELGIDDPEQLARELVTIGRDVGEILEAARAAAEGIRERATTEADERRSETDAITSEQLSTATEESEALRSSAWDEGSAMLAAATAESNRIIAEAKEDALFVRAEAEREALRLTGDAKRDREETIRAARIESDQMVESARLESEGVLAAARQQAEMAQERARVLEDRRSELLKELEATRASIGELENEIESRRQELEEPEPEVEDIVAEASHHHSDGGSVRIVAPDRAPTLEPVDAEAIVAEVEALRNAELLEEAVRVIPPPAATQPRPPTPETTQGPVDSIDAPTTELEPVAAPLEPADTAAIPATREETVGQTEVDQDEEGEPERTPEPEAAAVPVAPRVADDIGSLFARLKDEPTVATPTPQPEPSTDRTAEPDQVTITETAQASTPHAEAASPTAEPPMPDALDTVIVPAQNDALRMIKRSLVDLQNETLELLRTDPAWTPDESFTDRFGAAFEDLTTAVHGHADTDPGAAFAADLYDALTSSIDRARSTGAGEREVAAAASKVFRMWRSDEAERRVAAVAEPAAIRT